MKILTQIVKMLILQKKHRRYVGASQRRITNFNEIRNVKDGVSYFRTMMEMAPQQSMVQFNRLMILISKKFKEHCVALDMFDEMHRMRFPLDVFSMNVAVNCLCHLKQVNSGFAVIGLFLKRNYEPDVVTFTALINGLFLDGRAKEAEALFRKVLALNLFKPNHVMMVVMVDGLSKSGQVLKAHAIISEFERIANVYSVKSYNCLINGFFNNEMPGRAVQLLGEMRRKLIQPDIVTFTSILDGLFKHGMGASSAPVVLCKMIVTGIKPDLYFYNSIINVYAQNGAMEKAIQFFNTVIQPDVVTFTSIIGGMLKHGMGASSAPGEVLCKMIRLGFEPDLYMCNSIIYGYAQNGSLKKAIQIFDTMLGRGLRPDGTTLFGVLTAYANVSAADKALHILDSMSTKFGITPNDGHVNVLITMYGRMKEKERMLDLLMKYPSTQNNTNVLTSVLSSCSGSDDLKLAEIVFYKILDIDKQDSSAYTLMRKVYMSANKHDHAYKVDQLMLVNNVKKKEAGISRLS